MATLIVKCNPLQGTPVLVADMGTTVPTLPGELTFTDEEDIDFAKQSIDLMDLLTDDVFAVGSSTLILNDGASDIPQSQALDFLAGLLDGDGLGGGPPDLAQLIITRCGGLVYDQTGCIITK